MLAISGIDLIRNSNAFKVTAQSPNAMYVDVAVGNAIVNGGWITPDSSTSLAIPTASTSYNRYDAVVIEYNNSDSTRAVALKIVQGAASSNPQYPTLTQTTNIYQIPVAYILVEANTSSIASEDIIDVRSDYQLSANVRTATDEHLGVIKGGDTVDIDDDGTLDVKVASRTQLGVVKIGANLRITEDGTLSATGGGGGGGASALYDLEDVDMDFNTLSSGQGLFYDDTDEKWHNETLSLRQLVTLSASSWSNGVYSLESLFPSSTYDIQISPCTSTTDAQLTAWALAKPLGSPNANTITAKGITPTIDITVQVFATKKGGS